MTPTDLKDMHDAEMRGGEASELKPCPFCGEAPYNDTETATVMGDRTGHYFAVSCRNCEASAQGANSWMRAVDNWNTRADLAPDGAAFVQMREALLDATAHLVGAASAYKTFAKRHRKFGVAETDALYGTRLKDFNAAIDRSRAALKSAEGK